MQMANKDVKPGFSGECANILRFFFISDASHFRKAVFVSSVIFFVDNYDVYFVQL